MFSNTLRASEPRASIAAVMREGDTHASHESDRAAARPGRLARALVFVRNLVAEELSLLPDERRRFRSEWALRLNRRVALMGPLLVVVHLAHVGVFAFRLGEEPVAGWASGIFTAHLVMAVVAAGLSAGCVRLLRRERPWAFRARSALAIGAAWLYLLFSACIAGVDQAVTSSVTPFVVGSLAVALALPLPASVGAIGHAAALVVFAAMMARAQPDPEIRLSNQVNGLTLSVFAFAMSRVVEGARVREFATRRLIERQQAALEKANEELRRLATQDALTGLANRRHLLARTEQLRAVAARHRRALSVVAFDVDHFKQVNDTYGHAVGDDVLREVAQALRDTLRVTDIAGRMGGEEFVVVLPETPFDGAFEVAERVRQRVERIRLESRPELRVTVSAGVADLDTRAPNAIDEGFARADTALYEAKNGGRNRSVGRPRAVERDVARA